MSRKVKQQNKVEQSPSQNSTTGTLKDFFKPVPAKVDQKSVLLQKTTQLIEYIENQNLNPKDYEIEEGERGYEIRLEIKEIGKQKMVGTFPDLLKEINERFDKKIVILNLNANDIIAKIDVTQLKELKAFKGTLRQLTIPLSKHLSLQNKSCGKIVNELMDIISQLQLLEKLHLNLSNNHIGQSIKDIILRIGKLNKLTNLYLSFSNCEVKESDFNDIGKNLSKLQTLTKLSLNFMKNGIPNPSQLFFYLASMTGLRELELDLRYNDIDSTNVQQICFSLEQFTFLNKLHLNLSNNKVYKEGAKYLGMTLKKLSNLTDLLLSLQWDNIQDQGCEWLGQELSQMDQLIKLRVELWFDKIKQPEIICNHIMKMSNLFQVNTFVVSQEKMPLNYILFESLVNTKFSILASIIAFFKLQANLMAYNPNYVMWDLHMD